MIVTCKAAKQAEIITTAVVQYVKRNHIHEELMLQ